MQPPPFTGTAAEIAKKEKCLNAVALEPGKQLVVGQTLPEQYINTFRNAQSAAREGHLVEFKEHVAKLKRDGGLLTYADANVSAPACPPFRASPSTWSFKPMCDNTATVRFRTHESGSAPCTSVTQRFFAAAVR
jgi:hypothetical protein